MSDAEALGSHWALPSASQIAQHPERAQAPLSDDASAFIARHALGADAIPDGFTGLQDGTETPLQVTADAPVEAEQADGDVVEIAHGFAVPPSLQSDAVIHEVLNLAQAEGVKPETVSKVLASLATERAQQTDAWTRFDRGSMNECTQELREVWGKDAAANFAAVRGLEAMMPHGAFQTMVTSRGADGVALGNRPDFLEWLNGVASALRRAAYHG